MSMNKQVLKAFVNTHGPKLCDIMVHIAHTCKQEAQSVTYRVPEYTVPPLLTGRSSCFFSIGSKHKLDRGH